MLNWKVLLRSNRFYVVFILLLMLFVFLAFVIPRRSVYEKGLTTIEGRVLAYKIDGNFLSLTVKGKEKIQAFYYFQTEEEKLDYLEHLGYGVIVRMEGVLESPESNSLPNTFDYQKYLYYQDIYYVLDVQRLDFVKPSTGLYSFKNFVYRKLYNMKHGDYLVAMILGNTSHLDNQDVRKNGISHLFAISGMQITLLAKVVSFIFRRFGTKRDIGILFMLWIYAFLVGFTPSVMRAVLFWCYQFLNRKMGLHLHKTQIFLWVLGTILLFSPFAIMNLGFQYSFLISFVLMHMKFSKHYLKSSLQISLVSFLVSLPITAINFYSVNVLSILWNLFFVPFVSFGLFPLCFLSIFFPFLEGILGIGITLFEVINHWCASFIFGVIVIPKVSIIWWGVYFGVLGCFLFLHKKQCVFLLVILLCLIKYPSKLSSHAYVYFLDVGQGDATLFIGPHQKEVILLDTGGKITYSKERWEERKNQVDQAETIKTFLNSLDISNIDTLILSHGDYDHMGEAINLVNNFKVEKVIFNCGPHNDLEQELIKVLHKKKIPYYSCIKELNIDDNKLYFLNNKDYGNENDNSSVIYTELNKHKFLFMGDAGVEVEDDLIEKYNLQNIDVLKVGHHGSKTSSSEEFIGEINPKYSVISVGKNNRYGHPNDSVLENLEDSKIYRTDEDGSIMFKIDNDKLKIKTCAP